MESNCLSRSILLLSLFSFLVYFGCQDTATSENQGRVLTDLEQKKSNSESTKNVKPSFKTTDKHFPVPAWPITAKKGRGKVFPFDEASKDQSFVNFRQKLYNALNEKNIDYLLSVVTDSVFFSFGGDAGKREFVEFFELSNAPEKSFLWNEMALCLELGGKYNPYDGKQRFMAPYTHMVEDFEDPYMEGVIIGDNVRLRDQPGSDSKIIGSLNWDHCELLPQDKIQEEEINGETHPWLQVKSLNGEKGFVYGKYFRSPIDYRVGFIETKKGEWMIDFFIAGD